jgi:hypothetical protein
MPVTKSMVAELTNGCIKDMAVLGQEVTLAREGEYKLIYNDAANMATEELKKTVYVNGTPYELLPKFKSLFQVLKNRNLLDSVVPGEYHWIPKLAEIVNSEEILEFLNHAQYTTYGYENPNEVLLQSIGAMILAYNSNPTLLANNKSEFKELANTWLTALLTFNCRRMPELAMQVDGWNDEPIYSVDRNLILFQIFSEQYLHISKPFANATKMAKWTDRVTAFEEILKIMPQSIAECRSIMDEFPGAVSHMVYVNDSTLALEIERSDALLSEIDATLELTLDDEEPVEAFEQVTSDRTIPLAQVVAGEEARTAEGDQPPEPVEVAVALDADRQDAMDAGVNLMIRGISNLVQAANGLDGQDPASVPDGETCTMM